MVFTNVINPRSAVAIFDGVVSRVVTAVAEEHGVDIAVERVVAVVAEDDVVAAPGIDNVVAGPRIDRVVAALPDDLREWIAPQLAELRSASGPDMPILAGGRAAAARASAAASPAAPGARKMRWPAAGV